MGSIPVGWELGKFLRSMNQRSQKIIFIHESDIYDIIFYVKQRNRYHL